MKRRYANKVEGDYYQDRLETDFFSGYVCFIKIKNVEKPLIVNTGTESICIEDNNYEWFELYPDNEKYALTIMFDDNDNLTEWYFDIAKNIGLENGIPYEDDLYLDMIITPEGKVRVIDEDELLDAEKQGTITRKDVESAYETLEYLKQKFANDIDSLIKLTNEVKKKFKT